MNAGKNSSSGIQEIVWKRDVELMSTNALVNHANEVVIGSRFDGVTPDDVPT